MPGEYYRRQAARVRGLAHDAMTLVIRDDLMDVALQYEKLAEGAEASYRYRIKASCMGFTSSDTLPAKNRKW